MLDVANIGKAGENLRSFSIDFLTSPQCGLCGTAESITSRVAGIARARLNVIDVNDDEELFACYEHRIPVVLGPDGTILGEGHIKFGKLLREVGLARIRWIVKDRPPPG